MIQNLSITLILGLLFVFSTSASELTFDKTKPQYSDTITITYKPDLRYSELAANSFATDIGPYLVIDAYDGMPSQPKAYSIKLDSVSENIYSTSFIINDNEAFLDMKIVFPREPQHRDDHNNGDYWSVRVFGEDGLPVRNSNYYRGLSLAGGNSDKNKNLKEALDSYADEAKLYLNNYLNQIALKSLMLDLRKLTFDKYKSEMQKMLAEAKYDMDDENSVRAFSRLYNIIGEKEKSKKNEKSFVLRNPKSQLSEEFLLDQLTKAQSRKEFTSIADQYIKSFGASDKAKAVYTALNSVYIEKGDYSKIVEKLSSFEKTPSQVWADLANSMITDKNFMPQDSMAARIDSAKAVLARSRGVRVEDQIVQVFLEKPRNVSSAEGIRQNELEYAGLLISYGDFHYTVGEDETAARYYKEAISIIGESAAPPALWQQVILTEMNTEGVESSTEMAINAIKLGKWTDKIIEFYKESYIKSNKEKADFADRKVDELKEEGYESLANEAAYFDVNQDSPSAIFSTLDGMYVDTDDWEGKTIVLSFISSWCAPCEELLVSLSALDYFYAEQEEKLFYAVSSWEREKDKKQAAQDIVDNSSLGFPLLIDETDIIPQKFDVTGLPTTLILDGSGNIRFRIEGMKTKEEMVQKIRTSLMFLDSEE